MFILLDRYLHYCFHKKMVRVSTREPGSKLFKELHWSNIMLKQKLLGTCYLTIMHMEQVEQTWSLVNSFT